MVALGAWFTAATMSVTVVLLVIGPLVPLTVSVWIPIGVEALVDTASVVEPALDTEAGVKDALAPEGRPSTSKLTLPVKPSIGPTVAGVRRIRTRRNAAGRRRGRE